MHKEDTRELKYRMELIEKCPAPEGITGDDWHHYVIGRGISKVEGKRAGTLREVTKHVKDLAERINARSDKNGIVYASTYTPRKPG